MTTADWIAVDWGTSNVRAWAMATGGDVLDQRESGKGMGVLTPEAFEPALLELVLDWVTESARTRVIACGMVGARQGWIEAPYVNVPCVPGDPAKAVLAPTRDSRLDVRILPGVSQTSPFDVMRGEETQISGFLADRENYDGTICLPGTHSKWSRVENGIVTSFRTFMTGELFALLSRESVLRHSVGSEGWDDDAFLDAVDVAVTHPDGLSAELFGIRARSLLSAQTGGAARARLSGLLVGAELAAMKVPDVSDVALIGSESTLKPYAMALSHLGIACTTMDGSCAVLVGLKSAYTRMGD